MVEIPTTVYYMSTGQINVKPIITHRLQLTQGPDTFKKIVNREESFGKILFYPEED